MVEGSNGTCWAADALSGGVATVEGLSKAPPFSLLWLVSAGESVAFLAISDVIGKPFAAKDLGDKQNSATEPSVAIQL